MGPAEPQVVAGREHGLAGLLSDARGHGFVGRTEELAAFADSLTGASAARVHLVHGPGGIGKSTLLDAFARLAVAQGHRPVYLDAKDVECTGTAVAAAIAERSAVAGYGPEEAPDVLLLDSFELLAPLERWVREDLLPARPRTSVTVVAGREPPSCAWRLDPGWRRLARIHGLTELDGAQSADLLARLGVAPADRAGIVRVGRGHPLVLAMLAEARGGSAFPVDLADAPDVVARLCRLLVEDGPDAAHRAGLATCAHATRMTADLLRTTVGSRAEEVWALLESRPYVRRGAVGLFLHDVVREVFEAEFSQRSPDAYAALHVAVRSYFLGRLADPGEPHPDRAAAELLFLHRRGPLSEMMATLREGGLLPVARAGPEDRTGILALIEGAEGPLAAALAGRYVSEQPGCLYRARSDEGRGLRDAGLPADRRHSRRRRPDRRGRSGARGGARAATARRTGQRQPLRRVVPGLPARPHRVPRQRRVLRARVGSTARRLDVHRHQRARAVRRLLRVPRHDPDARAVDPEPRRRA